MYTSGQRDYRQYDERGPRQQFQQRPIHHNVNKDDTLKQLLSNQRIKQALLDYIYDVVELQKFKYKILKTREDLQELQTNRFYISGNYAGNQCLLVFCKNKDRYYQFVINKKTLTYQQNKINIDAVQLEPVSVGLDGDIYNGTIFDGIFSQIEQTSKRVFIITDVYYFKGDDMTAERVKNKLMNVKKYLENNINPDKNLNDIDLMVNHLSNLSEIETLVNDIIPKTHDIPIKGITFYPHISGQKLIYLFNPVHTMDTTRPVRDTRVIPDRRVEQQKYVQQPRQRFQQPYQQQQFQQPFQRQQKQLTPDKQQLTPEQHERISIRFVRKSSINPNEPIVMTFDIRKTEQSDVYKLLVVYEDKSSGKTVLKTKKIGIAYIPTTNCSKMCKDLTMNTGRALVKCKYIDDKEKWVPIEGDTTKKCPDLYSKLEDKFDIIIDEA
jgi:hypothetical protein